MLAVLPHGRALFGKGPNAFLGILTRQDLVALVLGELQLFKAHLRALDRRFFDRGNGQWRVGRDLPGYFFSPGQYLDLVNDFFVGQCCVSVGWVLWLLWSDFFEWVPTS